MPGAAAQTAGMASIAGIAVMIMPSTMKSSNVSATKSGGGRISTRVRTHGRPSISTKYPPPISQSGSNVGPLRQRTLRSITLRSPTQPCQLALIPATRAGGDGPRRHHHVVGRRRELRLAAHVVELDAERVGDHPHRVLEHRGAGARHVGERGVVDRAAEADRDLGLGGVVPGGVGRLEHRDRVDPIAEPGRHDGQHVGEPGVDAAAEDRHAAASHASMMRSRPSPSEWPVMNAAVDTMLTPASRIRTISSTSGHFGL